MCYAFCLFQVSVLVLLLLDDFLYAVQSLLVSSPSDLSTFED